MNQRDIAELKAAVERAHRCPATYRTVERVREQQRQFDVAVFDILGHPRALVCYAWLVPVEGSDKRRAFTVLREGPIHSSIDAVRFSLEEGWLSAAPGAAARETQRDQAGPYFGAWPPSGSDPG